jgi:hypothetical protein
VSQVLAAAAALTGVGNIGEAQLELPSQSILSACPIQQAPCKPGPLAQRQAAQRVGQGVQPGTPISLGKRGQGSGGSGQVERCPTLPAAVRPLPDAPLPGRSLAPVRATRQGQARFRQFASHFRTSPRVFPAWPKGPPAGSKAARSFRLHFAAGVRFIACLDARTPARP